MIPKWKESDYHVLDKHICMQIRDATVAVLSENLYSVV